MTIHEILVLAQDGLIGLVVLLLGLIRIPKIDINFWTLIFRGFGRLINGELMTCIDKIDKELENHIKKTEEERARQARQRILRFSDEVFYEKGHSQEHYNEILDDIGKYEQYCNGHPDFKNNKAVMAIEMIKDAYQDCIENHDFLEYKKDKGGESK